MRAGSLLAIALWAVVAHADYMDHFVFREDVGPHKAPYLGATRLVVIPVEVAGFPLLDMPAIERFFSPDQADGFVQYFETASLGRYRPRVLVAPKVSFAQCPLPAAQFPTCEIPRGDVMAFAAAFDLMREIVSRADAAGFDFAQADVNGRKGVADGWADGVMVLLNVPFGGVAFPFGYFNKGDNLAGGTGGPLIVDGVKIGHFAIAGYQDVRVMVHEFGHLLGLTDLYDESQRYDGLNLSFMGAWLYDPRIPLPDAETRFRLRWANWHQVQGRQRVRIAPVETSGDVYRLGTGSEYLLIENRGPGAFDQALPVRGLAVFHVDRTVKLKGVEGAFVERLLDCVNCDPFHPYIRLVQADGRFSIEKRGPFNAENHLFRTGSFLRPRPDAGPLSSSNQVNSTNRYSGEVSGWQLDDVRLLEDGSIEVTLDAPAEDQCGETLCAEGEGCAPVTCAQPPAGCSSVPGGWGWVALLLLEQRLRRRQQVRLRRAASAVHALT